MKKLLFVYNADAGYFNIVTDIAHKIFSPATYPCSLCDLTYGILKIRPEWDDFVKNAPIPFGFLHKDEFLRDFKDYAATPLPVVFMQNEEHTLTVLLNKTTLDGLTRIEDLKQAILAKL